MARRMGGRTRMQLTGWRELSRNLQKLPDELQPRLVVEAMKQSAEPMLQDGIANAPDAEPLGEGLPLGVILSDQVLASQGEPAPRKDEAKLYFGVTGNPEAVLVEFGTGPRFHESGKFVGQMPAQPFIRPAFDANARTFINRLGGRLGRLVEGAARRLNKGR